MDFCVWFGNVPGEIYAERVKSNGFPSYVGLQESSLLTSSWVLPTLLIKLGQSFFSGQCGILFFIGGWPWEQINF